MIKVDIKPLSVNEAWKGKRFKTKKYSHYTNNLMLLLPNSSGESLGENERLELFIEWGLSNKGADIDNPAKCFIDALQKKYGFNDSKIYKLTMIKEIVKKGSEYIKFDIKRLNGKN